MIYVEGKHGIYAAVLKHSISPAGIQLMTMEIAYPRIILAELNTHGMLCKNSSSSRAIPFAKMQEQLTGRPVRFGQANPGMQDKGEDFDAPICYPNMQKIESVEEWWETNKEIAAYRSKLAHDAGFHKQVYNRVTEPYQMMKTVISWTEGANFFWLRNHDAADPSLHELARVMYEAASQSEPQLLHPGEWHLPYVVSLRSDVNGGMYYFLDEPKWDDDINPYDYCNGLTLEQAIKVSTARTAAVSFRNVDYGVEKSEEVFVKLTSDERIHGSAMAHQATPMSKAWYCHDCHTDSLDVVNSVNIPSEPKSWEPGVSHMDRNGQLWSAQFRGWRQHRKLIPGENKEGFL